MKTILFFFLLVFQGEILNARVFANSQNLNLKLSYTSLPMPVDFLDFKGWVENNEVNLVWTTATETNNKSFTIETSRDGINFFPIHVILSEAHSSSEKTYSYKYTPKEKGDLYYRIKQTDKNDYPKYHKTIHVNYDPAQISSGVFPNPSEGAFSFNYSVKETDIAEFHVYGPDGTKKAIYPLQAQSTSLNFENTGLQKGIYYGHFILNNKTIAVHKLLIK